MLKRTITYTDFEDVERVEDFYFNLTKAEVIKMLQTSGDYSLDKMLERLTKERNGKKIMEIFENILHAAYGEKSLDGRRFIKNEEIWENFYQTEAYSVLFTELVTDAAKAVDFVIRIMPKDMTGAIKDAVNSSDLESIPENLRDYVDPLKEMLKDADNKIAVEEKLPTA